MGLKSATEPLHILDTNTVVAIKNGNAAVIGRLAKASNVCVSSLVVEEILIQGHGAEINRIRSGRSRADLNTTYQQFVEAVAFLATFRLIPYTADAEAIFKGFRAAKLKGMDGRIAAHALSLGAILVTENVRDFAGMPGLVVENWAGNG